MGGIVSSSEAEVENTRGDWWEEVEVGGESVEGRDDEEEKGSGKEKAEGKDGGSVSGKEEA